MNALSVIASPAPAPKQAGFDFGSFSIFTRVPEQQDFGIAAVVGMVAVYDEGILRREGIIEGALYVRERQRPACGMHWEHWLRAEWNQRGRQSGPAVPLSVQREVVQAIRWPYADDWSVRLVSGYVDGPYQSWAFGTDFIGKVVGVYLPAARTGER